MNERIRLLARQVDACYIPRYDMWQMDTESLKKFAELIVRECARKVNEDTTPDSGYTYEPWKLLKHFGVEEQEKVASKPECSVCGTTENVKYMGGFQPYLCDSVDCIPF